MVVSAHRERCDEVRDVHVVDSARHRAVATALMSAIESWVGRRGLERVGLTVGLEEAFAPARALYHALGYVAAHGPFVSSVDLHTDDGPKQVLVVARYLVKDLASGAAAGRG
jgi:hypothetical protein